MSKVDKIKPKKDKSKFFLYVIAIGCLILFAIILVSSLLEIGERFRNLADWGIYLEIGFYILVLILIYLLIIRPIVIIVSSPDLSIVTTMDEMDSRAVAIYKKVAKNIVKNNELPQEEVLLLTEYKQNEELLINLNTVFNNSIKSQLNKIIINNAKIVLISTAICQNPRIDTISVFTINLKMIKELVERCGFRPSMKNLSKLTIKVFGTALIAEGLNNIKLTDVIPANMISQVPIVGKALDSVAQGAINALLTLRIGCVTRRYLFTDGTAVTKEAIQSQAFKESMLLIPQVIAGTVTFFPKKIVSFFTDRFKKEKGDLLTDGE